MAFSTDGSSTRLCSICLDSVLDDNNRGKAELICGHLFHLDCIGSEFNYRGEMRCPNCRVIENGEWLLPDDESDDSDSQLDERRLEIHIYSHDVRNDTSTSRGQLVVAPTIHYHQRTVVVPPTVGGNTTGVSRDPLIVDALRRASHGPQGFDSTGRSSVERAVPQNSSNVEELRYYPGSSHQQSSPSSMGVDTTLMHGRINQNTLQQTNTSRFESMSAYQFSNDRYPSTELRLSASSSENQLARFLEEQQHGIHEHLGDGADKECSKTKVD